jgi:hypothetical protein
MHTSINHSKGREMNKKKLFLSSIILLVLILLSSCMSAAAPDAEEFESVATQAPVLEEPMEAEEALPVEAPQAQPTIAAFEPAPQSSISDEVGTNRLIIKNAEIRLEVEDTDVAIDRLTQVVDDVGGYIISTRVWYDEVFGENYKYATITIGVPVDEFERALRRLRSLAITVLDEIASGEDVTDEYVDLESRLENLRATRDRIREFLDKAETVEEALQVNEQLAEVEGEIAQVQGRMNYLFDRAAFSTITINLEPHLPGFTPTPTLTPTPTPTPTPWQPGQTFVRAGRTLGTILRALVEIVIWLVVVALPLLLVPALVVVLIWWLLRRRRAKKTE